MTLPASPRPFAHHPAAGVGAALSLVLALLSVFIGGGDWYGQESGWEIGVAQLPVALAVLAGLLAALPLLDPRPALVPWSLAPAVAGLIVTFATSSNVPAIAGVPAAAFRGYDTEVSTAVKLMLLVLFVQALVAVGGWLPGWLRQF